MAGAQPRIVIIGGGAGGLHLATRLSRKLGRRGKAEITLVDETLAHIWKPSLHEFAAGTKGVDAAVSFLEHANRNRYQFRLGRFAGIDIVGKTVQLEAVGDADDVPLAPSRQIPFDYLIIAIGSRSNDFGCKGVVEHCWFLDTPAQARRLQTQLLNLCLRLETGALGEEKSELNVCIIGGGATGVELAAELREATEQFGLHGIDKLRLPKSFNITLLEASPRLLGALPEAISSKVLSKLTEIDVDVMVSAQVSEVTSRHVKLENSRQIPAEMVIWAAGIKAPEIIKNIDGLKQGTLGRIKVKSTLQTLDANFIFAFGDCAECDWPQHGGKLPPRAQVAAQQASFLVRQLQAMIEDTALREFKYVDRGSLVAISNSTAVAAFMGKAFGTFTMEGFIARLGYRYLHFAHEAAIQGYSRAIMKTLLNKAMKRIRPQLKLH